MFFTLDACTFAELSSFHSYLDTQDPGCLARGKRGVQGDLNAGAEAVISRRPFKKKSFVWEHWD
jgi:hypothetical protein